MRQVTLCFLVDEDNICLAMKKCGFGEGKWNGVGGKVQSGESIEEATLREMQEEIGVVAEVGDLIRVGDIEFYFNGNPEWDQHMYIYFVHNWDGAPTETDEMKPEWYKKDAIPYDKMWEDDIYWLPKALSGEKIKGKCYFKKDSDKIEKFELNGELMN